MVFAGIIEGTITGLFQWSVLKSKFERLPPKSWVGFTIAGAAAAWLLGMIPSTFWATSLRHLQFPWRSFLLHRLPCSLPYSV
jgi:hypothetical protein